MSVLLRFTRKTGEVRLYRSFAGEVLLKPADKIPDVRDGLTREERVVLYVLQAIGEQNSDSICAACCGCRSWPLTTT